MKKFEKSNGHKALRRFSIHILRVEFSEIKYRSLFVESSALVIILGIVGSVASVVGLFIAAPGTRSKVVHVIYGIAITAISASAVEYHNQMTAAKRKIEETYRIEREAQAILNSSDTSTEGSKTGLMLAGLSFLEKNKSRFPDTYSSAKRVCESSGIYTFTDYGLDNLDHFKNLQQGSSAMYFLLKGIATSGTNNRD